MRSGSGNGVTVVGQPIIQVFSLSDGNIRLQADMPPDLGVALQTIGAVLSGRKAPVAV